MGLTVFVWVPAHLWIRGKELADKVAKEVDLVVNFRKTEFKSIIYEWKWRKIDKKSEREKVMVLHCTKEWGTVKIMEETGRSYNIKY